MATPVIMPRQGQSVESCIIVKWLKKVGDKVNVGDILFTYETDKAAFDEEAKVEGTLLDIFFKEDDDVPVLTNVCVIGNTGESTSEFNPNAAQNTAAAEKAEIPAVQAETVVEKVQAAAPQTANSDDVLKISPRARGTAERTGVDYRYAVPTGPQGRIIERDILNLRENGPVFTPSAKDEYGKIKERGPLEGTGLGGRVLTSDVAASGALSPAVTAASAQGQASLYQEVKLSNMRKVIAKAMQQSLSSTAQLTLQSSFDATEILEYRKKLKEGKDKLGLENITINDIILYAVSRTLKSHSDLNAHLVEDRMLIYNNVHLGVATDTDRGLMVPTLFNADTKSLNEISSETKQLIQECRKGTINPDTLRGGTFTITNLGTLGIEAFTPVLNPPQTGILGVNNITQRAREVDGSYQYYPAMGLSLTFDHRALDGAPAARFLKDLVDFLENFTALLAK